MYRTMKTPLDPQAFHAALHRGEILRFDDNRAFQALIALTLAFLETELHPYDPTEIHRHLSHGDQVDCFTRCEKAFSQSAEVRDQWHAVFVEARLDPAHLAHDRLHLRSRPHRDKEAVGPRARTTATIAFHRDTWGSNLYAQVNWWAPVYPISAGRTFAIYPTLWDKPLRNTTRDFDLKAVVERSKRGGRNAVDADQAIPHLLEAIDTALAKPVVIPPGTVIAFSSAHAHAGVPNHSGVTRISLETRTVWIDDVRQGNGAPNVDGEAPWAFPGLFRRVSDGMPLNEILGVERISAFPVTNAKAVEQSGRAASVISSQ
jgi:hypothetical protein